MVNLSKDLIEEINVAAYYLAKQNHPYDTLCWILAEKRLIYKNPGKNISDDIVKQNAALNFHLCCDYDIMCWLISELDILLKYELYGKDI